MSLKAREHRGRSLEIGDEQGRDAGLAPQSFVDAVRGFASTSARSPGKAGGRAASHPSSRGSVAVTATALGERRCTLTRNCGRSVAGCSTGRHRGDGSSATGSRGSCGQHPVRGPSCVRAVQRGERPTTARCRTDDAEARRRWYSFYGSGTLRRWRRVGYPRVFFDLLPELRARDPDAPLGTRAGRRRNGVPRGGPWHGFCGALERRPELVPC